MDARNFTEDDYDREIKAANNAFEIDLLKTKNSYDTDLIAATDKHDLPTCGIHLLTCRYNTGDRCSAVDGQCCDEPNATCTWVQVDQDGDSWETTCGECFCLESDTPLKNRMKFCCYCGKPLEEKPYVESEDDDD